MPGVTNLGTEVPWAPPVHSALMSTMRTISPNPRVAMARKTPRSRMTGRPSKKATQAPTSMPTGMPTTSGLSPTTGLSGMTTVALKPASDARPAWPRLSCPAMRTA